MSSIKYTEYGEYSYFNQVADEINQMKPMSKAKMKFVIALSKLLRGKKFNETKRDKIISNYKKNTSYPERHYIDFLNNYIKKTGKIATTYLSSELKNKTSEGLLSYIFSTVKSMAAATLFVAGTILFIDNKEPDEPVIKEHFRKMKTSDPAFNYQFSQWTSRYKNFYYKLVAKFVGNQNSNKDINILSIGGGFTPWTESLTENHDRKINLTIIDNDRILTEYYSEYLKFQNIEDRVNLEWNIFTTDVKNVTNLPIDKKFDIIEIGGLFPYLKLGTIENILDYCSFQLAEGGVLICDILKYCHNIELDQALNFWNAKIIAVDRNSSAKQTANLMKIKEDGIIMYDSDRIARLIESSMGMNVLVVDDGPIGMDINPESCSVIYVATNQFKI